MQRRHNPRRKARNGKNESRRGAGTRRTSFGGHKRHKRHRTQVLCLLCLFVADKSSRSTQISRKEDGPMRFWIRITILILVVLCGLNVSGVEAMASGAENSNPDRKRIERLLDKAEEVQYLSAQTSLTQAIVSLGDPVIDPLIERTKRALRSDQRRFIVPATIILSEMNKPRADNILLDLAWGRNTFSKFEPESLAAITYIDMMKKRGNKDACRIFFVNDRGKSYGYALRAIEGTELDRELFDKVCSFLTRDNFRNDALRVLAADPSTRFTEGKVAAICNSLEEIEKQPDRNRTRKNMLNKMFNKTDEYCVPHVVALAKIPGADSAIRTRIRQQPEGIARQCLWIALGNRGEITASREALTAFMKNPEYRESSILRRYAVEGYAKGGETQDLPFLQELAETDPYKIERGYQLGPDGPQWYKWGDEHINQTPEELKKPDEFLNRYEEAKKQIAPNKFIENYPIREAAKSAIRAIEARAANEGKSATPKPESAERKE